ncbi:MAG: ATP synthase F0 subunit C [Myxococcota bacterium]
MIKTIKNLALRASALFTTLLIAAPALAQDAAANESDVAMSKATAAAIAIGVAAFGGSLGQGMAARAALEGIARNPNAAGQIQTPLILSLALIESLVIYALLIAGGFIGPLGS